ncbi:rap guanine nucleotide exchange factor 4 isoform X2 [Neocloeon triangulifer]|uniref:rap guanine nucleotide exchange factor 4 isoform X2 n=1 Tax=Neocloeon triangulifer TaxID=2078957 RepID=UPI00286FA7F3|nr:rap guanine nucleotide exchange factor 4 isoform X2 [Neocloeon triangulifer]
MSSAVGAADEDASLWNCVLHRTMWVPKILLGRKKRVYQVNPGQGFVRGIQQVSIRRLSTGSVFGGDSIVLGLVRDSTVVTQDACELLRVESHDFHSAWQRNKEVLGDLVTSATAARLKNGYETPPPGGGTPQHRKSFAASSPAESPNPASSSQQPLSENGSRAGWVLHTLLLARAPGLLRERKSSTGRVLRRCAAGTDLVEWLMTIGVHSRQQATAMWQVLLEEGIITHVSREQPFKDKFLLYRFWQDDENGLSSTPSDVEESQAQAELKDALAYLTQKAPDAMMRLILRKPTHERTVEDLETIYEELLHIKALSHLSNSVKRELASVIIFESHQKSGTVLFHQGDEGHSWYIILKGSVNVVIHGKGVVTTLQEGDDFGKLALINDAPRSATIVLRENNCHFLRVDKDNFNRILRDVEANTVRLKEHGRDVLVLEKISPATNAFSHFKYTVMAGTPQKMLEHLLETRLDGRIGQTREEGPSDPFLDDFLLTHIVFMPTHQLVTELARHYRIDSPSQDREFLVACKRRVVHYVHRWVTTIRHPVFEEPSAFAFLEELSGEVSDDNARWEMEDENAKMTQVMDELAQWSTTQSSPQKWKLPPGGQPISAFGSDALKDLRMKPHDDIIFRVYCADHTYCTLRFPLSTTADIIKVSAADKLGLKHDDLILVEVKSSGERVVFKDTDVSIPTGLSLNGRIFVSPKEHLEALTCLPDQETPTEGSVADLELYSTKELAYHMTLFDWSLFCAVHEYELIYHTFGRHHFHKITSNLDVFLRRFNEIQFWVVTEICLTSSVSRRVQLVRKFIKLAAYCKEYQNLNAFCAIVMGLSNLAISRLSQTWDKVPSKARKAFTEFEALIDPSRNHRSYRMVVGKMRAPVVPFMPLLLKDMTFTHEGNKTCLDGLVNFEKMHMLAQTMRTIRHCRTSQSATFEPPSPKNEAEVKAYIRCLRVIDNQRVLTSLSHKLEPRRS